MFKFFSVLLPLIFMIPDQHKLVKTKITDNITVKLPKSFYPMTADDLARRYPSVRKPLGAYTNEDRLVDFSVNISATQWSPTDVKMAKDFFKASIYNLYDRVNMIKEEVVELDKKKFIVFEFDSRLEGEKFDLEKKDPIRKYSYIQYLIINGKTIVFSFNCPVQLQEEWQDIATEIMNSVSVKKGVGQSD